MRYSDSGHERDNFLSLGMGLSSQLHLRSGIDIIQFVSNFDYWYRSLKEANPENFSPIPLSVQTLWHVEIFRKPLIFWF